MGMFDTIRLKEPLLCPNCGAEHSEIQTHEFGDIMAVYGIGSVLSYSPVHSGIIKRSLEEAKSRETENGCPDDGDQD